MKDEPITMSFWDHLEEFRRRLFMAVLALVVTTVASLFFTNNFINLLALPIGGLNTLQSIEVTENIAVYMRVALLSGIIIAMPIILYEILAFVLPGLKPNEKRWLFVVIAAGSLLFLAGVAFTYFVMLPPSIQLLIKFIAVETKPRLSSYIDFITNFMFWIGVGFQTPLIVFALAKFNIISARTLLKQWRYAIVVIAIIAAVITPTVDPVNMALFMLPLIALYFLSAFLAFLARK
jgi:sec-independent protein translocase protein TatC